jgi:hypothetical protein
MLYNIARFYCRHRWVVGGVHVVTLLFLFVVVFNTPAMLQFATSLSRLPEDVRIRMYLFTLVLLASVYATLVLDLSLRHYWEDSKGARLRDTLLGVWESSQHNRGQEQGRLQLVVSFEDDAVYGRITSGTAAEAMAERVEITDIVVGDVFVLRATSVPTDRSRSSAARTSDWRLEFVASATREPYLVAWRNDGGQGDAGPIPQHVTLYKSLAASGR